jgi:hypothetical protein
VVIERIRRDEWIACGVLLALFVLLRIVAAPALAFDLLEPEELLNLRLVRQLQAGHPVGELGRYWYTGVGGSTGAGPFVLSLLYVVLWPFAEADVGANRLMATLWAIGGAVLLAAVARRLLGRGGAAAGLAAALALPPSWLAFTLTARGNYVEGAVLTLLAAWLLLRLDAAEGIRRKSAWALGLGWSLGFGAWFCVSAAPPALLLLLVAPLAIGRTAAPAFGGLVLGLALGLLPEIVGFGPATEIASPVGSDEVRRVAMSVLGDPLSWPGVVLGSLAAMPVLAYGEVPAEDWATGLQLVTRVPVALVGWLSVVLLAVDGLAGDGLRGRLGFGPTSWTRRGLLAALAICALGIPPALTAIGVAPEGLDVEQLYFYDPRRAAIVYPVIALGLATAGWLIWRLPAGRPVLGLALLFALLSQVLLAVSAEPPPDAFHPVRYLLCPSEQPVHESSVCVDALWEDQVLALEALVLHPELVDVLGDRRAALEGFGRIERDEDRCDAEPGGPAPGRWSCFGFGVAAMTGCGDERARELCAETPDPGTCQEGAEWGRALAEAP